MQLIFGSEWCFGIRMAEVLTTPMEVNIHLGWSSVQKILTAGKNFKAISIIKIFTKKIGRFTVGYVLQKRFKKSAKSGDFAQRENDYIVEILLLILF
jgi:hypothetical protein